MSSSPARRASAPIRALYVELLARYGPQGWWPLYDPAGGTLRYHPGDHGVPRGARRVEVIVGSILAQNTSWQNVERALSQMHAAGVLDWETLLECPSRELEMLIRPSGYFRQKARKLREAAAYFRLLRHPPARVELLTLWGIGPETADSILLYAFGVPVAVVDTYLRRVLARRGYVREAALRYEGLRNWIEAQVPAEPAYLNELHALVVAEGKTLRRRGP
ncbi:MAG: endonuclease III domain-containing protein [Gemmatimonadetes bacterium]|nr:endonuclease III domain-containing protein [Gemmatimonadota bacterium]